MTRLFRIIMPFFILVALFALLWYELFYAKPHELPSALIDKSVPNFSLPLLSQPQLSFTQEDLKGHVSLLNVWASWCYACGIEHSLLMKIKNTYHIPIYSINYKDELKDARSWLEEKGNPYVLTGRDETGDVAIDFGIYGTPETFLISPKGKIIYRQVGALNQKTWDDILYPLIKKYRETR